MYITVIIIPSSTQTDSDHTSSMYVDVNLANLKYGPCMRNFKMKNFFYKYNGRFVKDIYGGVLGPHKHFKFFFILHTFFSKIYTLMCKFF